LCYEGFSLENVSEAGILKAKGAVPSLASPVSLTPFAFHLLMALLVYSVLSQIANRYGIVFLSVKWSVLPPWWKFSFK
jgi:hypothetical protein